MHDAELAQRIKVIEDKVDKTKAARKELDELGNIVASLDGTQWPEKIIRVGSIILPDNVAGVAQKAIRSAIVARIHELVTEIELEFNGVMPLTKG